MNQDPITSGTAAEQGRSGPGGATGLQESAEQVKHSAKAEFEKMKGAARDQSAAARQHIREGAQSAAEQVKQAGSGFFDSQCQNLVRRVDAYAESARTAAECLRGSEGDAVAGAVETAAQQLSRFSDYLREKQPAELMHDIGSFARRRPEVVFGGMFLLGLVATRFLKASTPRPEREEWPAEDEYSYYGGESEAPVSPSSTSQPFGSQAGSSGANPFTPPQPSSTAGHEPSTTTGGSYSASVPTQTSPNAWNKHRFRH